MHTTTIINCLKQHGQLLDHEISAETGIPLDDGSPFIVRPVGTRRDLPLQRDPIQERQAHQELALQNCRVYAHLVHAQEARHKNQQLVDHRL